MFSYPSKTRASLAALLCALLFVLPNPGARAGQRARPESERVEVRAEARDREIVQSVGRDPQEWFRAERTLDAAEMDRLWQRLGTPERRRVSEAIGEREMDRMATGRFRWETRCSSRAASDRPQGFDAVYRSGNGEIIVGEAKGTSERCSVDRLLGNGYGFRQGSIEWAKASADAVLRSETTNWREKRAAQEVLDAAKENRLAVVVFVARHQNGRVVDRQVEQTAGKQL